MQVMTYRTEEMLNIWNSHKTCRKNVNDLMAEKEAVVELCEIKFKGSKFLRFIAPIFYGNTYFYGKLKFGKSYLTGRKVKVSLLEAFGVKEESQQCVSG